MRYLVCISYDGSGFFGFQKQKDKKTVQGEIEKVLSKILNKETFIVGCSRTDALVHANEMYFHFDSESEINLNVFRKSVNSLISDSIYVKSICCVNEEFNARYSVVEKEYLYKINVGEYNPLERNYVLQYNKKIDVNILNEASEKIVGEHNFRSFTSNGELDNYVRTVNKIEVVENGDYVYIYVSASGFLRYMVRNIVGLLLEINDGKKNMEDIEKIFISENRSMLGVCAPAVGLYLNKVLYGEENEK